MSALRIGTRGSALALWQARTVASLLEARGIATTITTIKTSGDRLQDAPLTETGTKGLFVKELEDALLSGAVDMAVHSAKDMSVTLPDGLTIAAVLPREDPRDAVVLRQSASAIGTMARVGTSSVRRSAQLRALWPDALFSPVRGNVDSRLRKLDGGEFDVLVLAVAGLKRLGHGDRITTALDFGQCVPAPCQGIVAIETRADNAAAAAMLNDARSDASFRAERALIGALGGGCQMPLGAVAVHTAAGFDMQAIVVSPDGARRVRHALAGDAARPEELGARLADELIRRGAVAILDEVR